MSVNKQKSDNNEGNQKAVDVFFSYSHKDGELRDELARHLSSLRRQGLISQWHDRKISPGATWKDEIDHHLKKADLILLLISSDFIASEYCYGIELTQAITYHKAGRVKVIPIILRPTDWEGTPFSELQALPKNGKPVTSWSNRDKGFLNITTGIRSVVESLNQNNIPSPLTTAPKPKNKIGIATIENTPPKKKPHSLKNEGGPKSPATDDQANFAVVKLKILSDHKTPVKLVSFSSDGTLLASASNGFWFSNASLILWQMDTEKKVRVLDEGTDYDRIFFVGNNEYLISGNFVDRWKWQVSTGARLPGFKFNRADKIIVSDDGTLLARIPGNGDKFTVEVVNYRDDKVLQTIENAEKIDNLTKILFSPNNELLAIISIRRIYIYNIARGSLVRRINVSSEESGFYALQFSPDNLLLATGQSGKIRLWNTSDGTMLRELEYDTSNRNSLHQINSLAFTPDGQFLAGSVDKVIHIWRIADGKALKRLEGHSKNINQIAFSPIGTVLASASDDKTVRLWHLKRIAEL